MKKCSSTLKKLCALPYRAERVKKYLNANSGYFILTGFFPIRKGSGAGELNIKKNFRKYGHFTGHFFSRFAQERAKVRK
jgi:hypothetical protein